MMLSMILSLAACDSSSVDLAAGDVRPTPTARPDSVSGRAESPSSGVRSGSVRAWRLDASGAVEAASAGSATFEDGEYHLDLDGEATGALVVEASFDDGTSASVLVAARGDGELDAAPMSAETTGEAGIWLRAGELGVADHDGSGAVLRAFVTAEVAAGWETADAEAQDSIALGVGAAVQAWEESSAHSEAAIEAFAETTAEADAGAAIEVDLVTAWEDAGAGAEELSYAAAAALEAQLAVSGDTDADDAESDLLTGLRGELALDVMADAATDFGDSDGEVWIDLDAILDGTLDEVFVQLGLDLSAGQEAEAEQQSEVTASLAAAAEATIAASAEESAGSAAAAAIAGYRATMSAEVQASLEASGEFDSAQAEAMARILAQVHLDPQ